MKFKGIFKLVVLLAALSALLVAPALGQTKEEMAKFKEQRAAMIKQLKLAPEKEKAVLALEDKYATEREPTIASLKKDREALEAALKAPNPDAAKIKELVSGIYAGMDKMHASFKSQRDEEMGQMTPVEQGKYLVAMMNWRSEMFKKVEKKAPAAPKKK